jgi:glutaredoxin
MTEVLIYGRPDCHLCEDALAVIERVRATAPFELVEIDIESDDELFKRYLERIPVVTIDGIEVFQFVVNEQILLDRVKAS